MIYHKRFTTNLFERCQIKKTPRDIRVFKKTTQHIAASSIKLNKPERPSSESVDTSQKKTDIVNLSSTDTDSILSPTEPMSDTPIDYSLKNNKAIKLAVIGDVHEKWDADDQHALLSLNADIAIFVGDIANENLDFLRQIASIPMEKAIVLGNHDAWYSLTPRGRQRALRVALQTSSLQRLQVHSEGEQDSIKKALQLFGVDHIGFSSKYLEKHDISFVGGRPFSKGGHRWSDVSEFYKHHFDIGTFQESAERITDTALSQPLDAALVFVAHNGPLGLGSSRNSPCGVDFFDPGDDFGDPDLEEALNSISMQREKPVALVLFGHMHHVLKGGQLRDMAYVDQKTGTVYLNAAVVPRVVKRKNLIGDTNNNNNIQDDDDSNDNDNDETSKKAHHFLVVEMVDGHVHSAAHTWVSPAFENETNSGIMEIVKKEHVIRVAMAGDGTERKVVSYYKAHSNEWVPVIVKNNP